MDFIGLSDLEVVILSSLVIGRDAALRRCVFRLGLLLKIAQRFNAGKSVAKNISVPSGTTGRHRNKHGSAVPRGTSDSYAIETQR